MTKYEGSPWWDPESKEPPHIKLMPLVRAVVRMQEPRRANMRRMVSVYENGEYSEAIDSNSLIDDANLHFNVAKNAMDSMVALVMAPKIAPMLMTEGGAWHQRRRAKLATKAVEGVLEENDWDELEEDVVLDAQLSYCGFVRVDSRVTKDENGEETARIRLERVMPEDVFVDEFEGRARKPPCVYIRNVVDRYQLLAMFGHASDGLTGTIEQRRSAILKAKQATDNGLAADVQTTTYSSDQIEVWEAWHLPSDGGRDTGKTDGVHVICLDGCTLLREPWRRPGFPLAVHRPEKARKGFWGLAAMRYALPGQKEYARVTRKLQRAHGKMGGSHFLVGRSAQVEHREITNDVGTIIEATDINQVREFTPTPANPQTYQYREGIAEDILRYLGLSQQTAQAEVPAGLSQASGKALQTFQDSENKRLVLRHRARERLCVDVSTLIIEEVRSLLQRGIKVRARYTEKHGFQSVDWDDIVDVIADREALVVRTFPINKLSQDPASKFAQLDMLLSKGAITVEQFKRLFGMPDLEAEDDIDCADYEIVDKVLDQIVWKGVYSGPEPWDNLAMCLERGRKFINACRVSEVPEERMQLLRNWMSDVQALVDRAAGKTASSDPMAGPGGPAGEPPMPMPGEMPPDMGAPPMGEPMMAPPPEMMMPEGMPL